MTTKTVNTQQKPRKKVTYTAVPLPAEGYIRLPSVLNVMGYFKNQLSNRNEAGKISGRKITLSTMPRF